MCGNTECESENPVSIEDHRVDNQTTSALAVLQLRELDRYEKQFGYHPEIENEEEDRLVEATFHVRKLCWDCARPSIEEAMRWRFRWLDEGISLAKHDELIEFLDYYQPLEDEWNDLLVWNYRENIFEWSDYSSLEEQVYSFAAQGVSPENVKSIAEWCKRNFREPASIDHIEVLINAGFRDEDDMDLLEFDELQEHLEQEQKIPSKETLVKLGIDGSMYHGFMLAVLSFDGLWPEESDVIDLVRTSVTLDQLAAIDSYLDEDDRMQAILMEFEGDELLHQVFVNTIAALVKVGLNVDNDNVIKYWGLNSELVLHVIDNDLLTDDVLRIARLLKEPSELMGWLTLNSGQIEPDEIQEWAKLGFDAQTALKWRAADFDAEIAQQWRAVIDDPVVAQRRISAGIQIGDRE
jgi:hypothetical protein